MDIELIIAADEYKYNFTFGDEAHVDVRADHARLIREAGAAGIVLLKNVNNTLPLKSPKHIGVFGNDAGDPTNGMSYFYFSGIGNFEYGVLGSGGGSGSGLFTYIVSPLDAIRRRAGHPDKSLVQYVLNNTAIVQPDSPKYVCLAIGIDREADEKQFKSSAAFAA